MYITETGRLLFDDLQNFHGACLHTDTTCQALAGGTLSRGDHDLHGADLHTLTTGGAELLIDHVHAGLGVLRNSTGLTDLHALAALNAGHGLCAGTLGNNADAGQILVKLLVECSRTSTDALQASHALNILLNRQSFHKDNLPFYFIRTHYSLKLPK